MTNLATRDKLDYRQMLQMELQNRRQKNPAYSLRAFAKHLGVSAAYLSQIFAGKRVLSEEVALRFATKLRWAAQKRKLFLNLLQYQRTRDEEVRELILKHVKALNEMDFVELKIDEFQLISEWQHFAITELIGLPGPRLGPKQIAKRLRLSQPQTEEAIERLLRLGMITKDETGLHKSHQFYQVKSVPSEAIRSFHKRHLQGAMEALETQAISERTITGTTMALDRKKLPEIRELIREFQFRLNEFCVSSAEPDSVYHLAVQLYRLDQEQK